MGLLQKLRVRTAKFLLPKASGVRVVSQRIADSITSQNIALKHPPMVLPIYVDTHTEKATEDNDLRKIFPQFKFIILMASRLTSEKRIRDGILALAEVLKSYPFAGLAVAGTGPEKAAWSPMPQVCISKTASNSWVGAMIFRSS